MQCRCMSVKSRLITREGVQIDIRSYQPHRQIGPAIKSGHDKRNLPFLLISAGKKPFDIFCKPQPDSRC